MLMRNRVGTRGDTLIEVLFAVTVFSLVAVGGLSIMNQGTAISQRALEITLVRQEIDSQAETLRFLNYSYIAAYKPGNSESDYLDDEGDETPASQWIETVRNITENDVSNFGVVNDAVINTSSCPSLPDGSFIMNTHSAIPIELSSPGNFQRASTFSQVRYNPYGEVSYADGIWIEAIRYIAANNDNNQADAGYIDFHIRACWEGPGQSAPLTIGTIVRLYTPVGWPLP